MTVSWGAQSFDVSGPHWEKSCLGLHIKYKNTKENCGAKKKVLSKRAILLWAALAAIPGHVWAMGRGSDTLVSLANS